MARNINTKQKARYIYYLIERNKAMKKVFLVQLTAVIVLLFSPLSHADYDNRYRAYNNWEHEEHHRHRHHHRQPYYQQPPVVYYQQPAVNYYPPQPPVRYYQPQPPVRYYQAPQTAYPQPYSANELRLSW